MISIYTSLYNISANIFNWQDRLIEFKKFADEVVVATTKNQDNSYLTLAPFCFKNDIKLVITDISLKDLDFDGRLKNAALKSCSNPLAILLDIDEYIPLNQKDNWLIKADQLLNSDFDAMFIPVVDLYHDINNYKSIGCKWYLHKNNFNIERGIVNFAKKSNGKIDHTKSDTCELIKSDGQLAKTFSYMDLSIPDDQKLQLIKLNNIFVVHEGWLNKEQRIKQQQFWQPVWSNRAGFEVKTEIDFNSIKYKKHNLF